ncbi:M15 family metallopeptidase [Cellulosimicrobium sp. PMB13]|uniref:M15 family metallopeptidase n=1 Tax=Cellulosimicrobium sp. PMB13 TaxID=3120158 RepID=UPI003F4C914F
MGRHSAPRTSLRSTLGATARLEALAARPVTGPRARRTAVGTGAALAAVALTATTAAAAFVDPAGTPAQGTTTPAPTTTSPLQTNGAPVVVADPAVIEAASDALVRAEYVTSEQAASLPADQAAKIEETRTRLSEAISANDGSTDVIAGATDAPEGADAVAADAAADAAPTEDADSEDARSEDAGATDAAGADDTGLAARGTEKASRSSERTHLDTLAAPLGGALDLPMPLEPVSAAEDTTSAGSSDDSTAAKDETAAAEAASADGAAADTPDASDPADTAAEKAAAKAAADEETATAADAEAEAAAVPASADEITALTAELRTLLDATEAGIAVEVVPGPPSAAEVAAQLDQWASSTAGYGNGQIPAESLCELSFAPGEMLRCDADFQIEALNLKYREAFGTDLSVTDSYRSYGSQVAVKASRGHFAATPGTSNHGWGLALDLGGGVQSFGSAQYAWLRANGPAFGWDNPEFARAGGSLPEAWHWEYGDLS